MSDQYRATRIIRRIYCKVIGCKMTRVNLRTAEKSNKRPNLEATVCTRQMKLKVASASANRAVAKRGAHAHQCAADRKQGKRERASLPFIMKLIQSSDITLPCPLRGYKWRNKKPRCQRTSSIFIFLSLSAFR